MGLFQSSQQLSPIVNDNKNENKSNEESSLPERVIAILQYDFDKGNIPGYLDLTSRSINDSMVPELCEWMVKIHSKVKEINLSYNHLTSKGAVLLFNTFKRLNSTIRKLWLYRNRLDDECISSLGEYIKSNKTIEIMSIGSNLITDKGIELLAPYLEGNLTFKYLSLYGSRIITDKAITSLTRMVESSHIEDIDIRITLVTDENVLTIPLAHNVIQYGSPKLDINSRQVTDDHITQICEGMKKFGIDKLKEIILGNNRITSRGASILFATLKECQSVVSTLNMINTGIDDDCMNELSEFLQDNQYLECLNIGYSKISDKSIEMLSEPLIGNISLKELYINENRNITVTSVPYLEEIARRSCVEKLNISATSIPIEDQERIDKYISITQDQREIPIKSNTKSAAKISKTLTNL